VIGKVVKWKVKDRVKPCTQGNGFIPCVHVFTFCTWRVIIKDDLHSLNRSNPGLSYL
jgi:hypothetical protein